MVLYLVIFLLIVVFDLVTKSMIASSFSLGQTKNIIKGILDFTYVRNEGAAFGMLQGARVFFIILTVVVAVLLVVYLIKAKPTSSLEKTAISFIAGGAIGNFFDRVFLGYVRDFIAVKFIDFPVFNVADCFVCIGAGLFILYTILDAFKPGQGMNADE